MIGRVGSLSLLDAVLGIRIPEAHSKLLLLNPICFPYTLQQKSGFAQAGSCNRTKMHCWSPGKRGIVTHSY